MKPTVSFGRAVFLTWRKCLQTPAPFAGRVQSSRVPADGSSCRHIQVALVCWEEAGWADECQARLLSSGSFPRVPPETELLVSPSLALSSPMQPLNPCSRERDLSSLCKTNLRFRPLDFRARRDQRSWFGDLQVHRPAGPGGKARLPKQCGPPRAGESQIAGLGCDMLHFQSTLVTPKLLCHLDLA